MEKSHGVTLNWTTLIPLIVVELWTAHAIAFFTHEYAHAVVAWMLGWKKSPLDLDYAHPSIVVFLIQLGINQKVDEAPIFAVGKGVDAAIIAVAGSLLGNGIITYPLSRLGYARAKAGGHPAWAMLAFWVTAASIGNFLDYVPIRTFSGYDGGDMGSLERGFGWSPWVVLFVLGAPVLIATVAFFGWIVPATMRWLFPSSPAARYTTGLLSVFVVFGFYGAAGLLEGGPIAYTLSQLSVFAVMPIVMIIEWLLLRRRERATEN